MMLSDDTDKFGFPLTELRHSPSSAEDARDRLERAKDEVRRALDDLRDLQAEYDAKQRVGVEVKSAIVSCIDVEKSLLTAIHRTENLVHRVRKAQTQEESVQPLREAKVEVPFLSKDKKHLIATFEVHGKVEKNERGEVEWVGEHKADLVNLRDKTGKEFDASEIASPFMKRLEDRALETFADEYISRHG